jgi:CheY-like chemotaxis protein
MKKVLLASANREFLCSNAGLLKDRGFQLITSTTAAEALDLHKEQQFDLIIADSELEEMSGSALCSLIRKGEDSPQVKVILICNEIVGSMQKIEDCGANAMLLRPVDQLHLLETIGRYTGLPLGRSKRVVVKVIVISKKRNLEFVCFSHNISITGILIETEQELELGSRIICQFALPGTHMIETEGDVARSLKAAECGPLYGIRFANLSLLNRRKIDNFIASSPE